VYFPLFISVAKLRHGKIEIHFIAVFRNPASVYTRSLLKREEGGSSFAVALTNNWSFIKKLDTKRKIKYIV